MKLGDEYRIHLNFLPVAGELPEFEIYRKLRADSHEQRSPGADIRCYSLPKTVVDVENRNHYWVAIQSAEGFEPFRVKASFNNHLTTWVLFKAIGEECKQKLASESYWLTEGGFMREIHFNMRQHDEGNEQLVIQPYRMRASSKFGLLADFHFRKKEEVNSPVVCSN